MEFNSTAVKACLQISNNFYLYDEAVIDDSINKLKAAFPQVEFLYSVKCNPNENVLRSIFSRGFGADAASAGEAELSRRMGIPADKIYYSAPGKTVRDIEDTLGNAVLIADSIDEIRRIDSIAKERKITVDIGIRINPGFTFDGDGGAPSKFGIDEEQAAAFLHDHSCTNVKVTGIHVHLKSQELSAEVLSAYYKRMLKLAEKFDILCGGLDFVNFGSGMGVTYAADDTPLDLDGLSASINGDLTKYRALHPDTKLIIEVGRYAVCKSGLYVTTVLDRKTSYGKTYLILKNTLNGFIRPSIARLISLYSCEENPPGSEPLFTSCDAFQFLTLKDEPASERVTLAGNPCTSADVIAEDILMPHLEPGDAVIVTNAGSYAFSLSPMQFSTQEKPQEFFLKQNGEIYSGSENYVSHI